MASYHVVELGYLVTLRDMGSPPSQPCFPIMRLFVFLSLRHFFVPNLENNTPQAGSKLI
jgi:hypothetical protein